MIIGGLRDFLGIFTTIFEEIIPNLTIWYFPKGLVQPPTIGMIISISLVFGVFLLAWDG